MKSKLLLLLTTTLVLFVACSGGSRGTGSTTVTGRILTVRGEPLADIIVKTTDSEDTVKSDEEGSYALESESRSSSLEVVFTSQDGSLNESVVVEEIAEDIVQAKIDINVDQVTNTIAQSSVRLTDTNGIETKAESSISIPIAKPLSQQEQDIQGIELADGEIIPERTCEMDLEDCEFSIAIDNDSNEGLELIDPEEATETERQISSCGIAFDLCVQAREEAAIKEELLCQSLAEPEPEAASEEEEGSTTEENDEEESSEEGTELDELIEECSFVLTEENQDEDLPT